MIIDTIIVVLVCIIPEQHPKEFNQNSFKDVFEQADKYFDRKYGVDIEKLKKASEEAVIEAEEKTKEEMKKALEPIKFEWP